MENPKEFYGNAIETLSGGTGCRVQDTWKQMLVRIYVLQHKNAAAYLFVIKSPVFFTFVSLHQTEMIKDK
jgi:hypothetical protein